MTRPLFHLQRALCLALLLCLALGPAALGETAPAPSAPSLSLYANPSTGYTWQYTVAEDALLAVTDTGLTPDPAAEGATGAGGLQGFAFTGKAAGTTTALFTYSRAWETEEPVYSLLYTLSGAEDLTVTILSVTFQPGAL